MTGYNLTGSVAVDSLQISAKSASTFSHSGCSKVEISAVGELAGSHHIRGGRVGLRVIAGRRNN
jgi:hypothetical protein